MSKRGRVPVKMRRTSPAGLTGRADGTFEHRDNDEGRPGVVERPSSPVSVLALQDAISVQACPFCGGGPFKVLAAHTNKQHGVSASDLRKMAGLGSDASICDPDASRGARDRLVARPDFEELAKRGGMAALAAGAHHVAREASMAKTRDALADDRTRALAMWDSNQRSTAKDIGRELGHAYPTVVRWLKAEGRDPLARRHVMNAERLGVISRSRSAS